MRSIVVCTVVACLGLLFGCGPKPTAKDAEQTEDKKHATVTPSDSSDAPSTENTTFTFGEDVAFLSEHTDIKVLGFGDARVAVAPSYQGRVMTSTATGDDGLSFGWVNRKLIESGEVQEHINLFGGEERFWMGPEGGQYAIFFEKGNPFDLDHWYTPAAIDTEPFDLVASDEASATFRREMQLTNYEGTEFNLTVDRTVRVLTADKAYELLGTGPVEGVQVVAYETENTITNTGNKPWEKDTGLLSIWILGMYTASEKTVVVMPFVEGREEELGPPVNTGYFSDIPAERLVVEDGVAYFKADARLRSKIGMSPLRAKSVLGSYDGVNNTLTVVQYNKPEDAIDYVKSTWELHKEPYCGDVINSYTDDGTFGKFYELETSSPAAALAPGESITHLQRTIHFVGAEEKLNGISAAVLGASTKQIRESMTSE
jgi:hypothetical protein